MKKTTICKHCGEPVAYRNPTGKCDHLYFPDNLTEEAKRDNGLGPVKVYVAEREYDYEGSIILGVFSTREKAQEICDNDKFDDGSQRGDFHDVKEFEIDAINAKV